MQEDEPDSRGVLPDEEARRLWRTENRWRHEAAEYGEDPDDDAAAFGLLSSVLGDSAEGNMPVPASQVFQALESATVRTILLVTDTMLLNVFFAHLVTYLMYICSCSLS